MEGKRNLGMYSGEYAKHLRKDGKKEFWKAYRRSAKSQVKQVDNKKYMES